MVGALSKVMKSPGMVVTAFSDTTFGDGLPEDLSDFRLLVVGALNSPISSIYEKFSV